MLMKKQEFSIGVLVSAVLAVVNAASGTTVASASSVVSLESILPSSQASNSSLIASELPSSIPSPSAAETSAQETLVSDFSTLASSIATSTASSWASVVPTSIAAPSSSSAETTQAYTVTDINDPFVTSTAVSNPSAETFVKPATAEPSSSSKKARRKSSSSSSSTSNSHSNSTSHSLDSDTIIQSDDTGFSKLSKTNETNSFVDFSEDVVKKQDDKASSTQITSKNHGASNTKANTDNQSNKKTSNNGVTHEEILNDSVDIINQEQTDETDTKNIISDAFGNTTFVEDGILDFSKNVTENHVKNNTITDTEKKGSKTTKKQTNDTSQKDKVEKSTKHIDSNGEEGKKNTYTNNNSRHNESVDTDEIENEDDDSTDNEKRRMTKRSKNLLKLKSIRF